jgi:hypothetical protein
MGFYFSDHNRTNFYTFYGKFEDIGLLHERVSLIGLKNLVWMSCWGLKQIVLKLSEKYAVVSYH